MGEVVVGEDADGCGCEYSMPGEKKKLVRLINTHRTVRFLGKGPPFGLIMVSIAVMSDFMTLPPE